MSIEEELIAATLADLSGVQPETMVRFVVERRIRQALEVDAYLLACSELVERMAREVDGRITTSPVLWIFDARKLLEKHGREL